MNAACNPLRDYFGIMLRCFLALLLVSRHTLDSAGVPVEWRQAWDRGDRYKFVTRIRRPSHPSN